MFARFPRRQIAGVYVAVALSNSALPLMGCGSTCNRQATAPPTPESSFEKIYSDTIEAPQSEPSEVPQEVKSTDAAGAVTLELAAMGGGIPNHGPLVSMTLKNTWTDLLWVSRVMGDTDLELSVIDASGKKLTPNCKAQMMPLTVDDYVSLAPGEAITVVRNISCYQLGTGARVKISAIYRDKSSAPPRVPLPVVTFWFRGTVTSNTVEVTAP